MCTCTKIILYDNNGLLVVVQEALQAKVFYSSFKLLSYTFYRHFVKSISDVELWERSTKLQLFVTNYKNNVSIQRKTQTFPSSVVM